MSRSVFFWNSGGTVDGNILPERKAQKRCFMFGDFYAANLEQEVSYETDYRKQTSGKGSEGGGC